MVRAYEECAEKDTVRGCGGSNLFRFNKGFFKGMNDVGSGVVDGGRGTMVASRTDSGRGGDGDQVSRSRRGFGKGNWEREGCVSEGDC